MFEVELEEKKKSVAFLLRLGSRLQNWFHDVKQSKREIFFGKKDKVKRGSSRKKQRRESKGSKKMASDKSSAVTSSSSQSAASQSGKVRQRQKQQRQDDPLDDPSTLQSQLSPDMVARPFCFT